MIKFPSRSGALALVLAVGFGLGQALQGHDPLAFLLSDAAAQAAAPSPAAVPVNPDTKPSPSASAADTSVASDAATSSQQMARTDAKGRHLAPHGTFYLLSYVAAKTDKGVDGFSPGQEVHLVEVHRATHTLVVTDGYAQVEVPPSKLTNDMDIAEMVRRNDQAGQAQIAAYMQAEEAAYNKFERDAAAATARDLERRKEQQANDARFAQEQQQAQANQQTTTPVDTTINTDGYYGDNGYGYGSPYSYFSGGGETVIVAPQVAGPAAPAAPAAAPAPVVNRVAAPESHPTAGRPK